MSLAHLLAVSLLFGVGVAWADPAQDLAACQAQSQVAATRAENERNFYTLRLTRWLMESTAQLEDTRQQLEQVRQELMRLKATRPDEKK